MRDGAAVVDGFIVHALTEPLHFMPATVFSKEVRERIPALRCCVIVGERENFFGSQGELVHELSEQMLQLIEVAGEVGGRFSRGDRLRERMS